MLDMYVGSSTIVLQFIPANCLRTDLFSNVDRWINEQHLNQGGINIAKWVRYRVVSSVRIAHAYLAAGG